MPQLPEPKTLLREAFEQAKSKTALTKSILDLSASTNPTSTHHKKALDMLLDEGLSPDELSTFGYLPKVPQKYPKTHKTHIKQLST